MAYTVKCYHCKMPLYTVQSIRFPLDYRTFVPASEAVDTVYDDPVCSFCERLFQVVPHDISMKKVVFAPLLTDQGVIKTDTVEPPPPPPSPKCKCGCGEDVPKEGKFLSRVHKAKYYAKEKRA